MVLDVVDSAFALLEERAEAAALLDAPELVESPGE